MRCISFFGWLTVLALSLALEGTLCAQTFDEEIAKVREALGASTNPTQQQALQDYLEILELNAAREKKSDKPGTKDVRMNQSIEKHDIGAFMDAIRAQVPLLPAHLVKVVSEYQKVCHSPSGPRTTMDKKSLLMMAETLLKREVANTGTRNDMLTAWFECFYILAPTQKGDASCSTLFEMLLVYMPDELTTFRRPMDGMSLLHLYAFPPVEEYLSLMLKLGFDKSLRNTLGQTPLDYLNSEVALLQKRQPELFFSTAELTLRYPTNGATFITERTKENTARNEQITLARRLLSSEVSH